MKIAGEGERESARGPAGDGFRLEDFDREAGHGCMDGRGETIGSGTDD